MPRKKNWKASKARKLVLLRNETAGDCSGQTARYISDKKHDQTDSQQSWPVIESMEQGAIKQMEVQARLSKPYGSSVQGASKQMGVKTLPFKPSGPSVLESLPSVLLDGLPDVLLNDKTDVLPYDLPEISNDTSNPFLCTCIVHGSFHQGDGR